MSLASALLKIQSTAKLDPAFEDNLTGRVTLGQTHSIDLSDSAAAYAFRAIFSAAAQTATLAYATGAVTLSASGTQQVETATITAAAGCTTSGNLTLTLTSAAVAGSPLTIEVPITTSAHTTAALIAAACAKKINTLSAVTSKFTVEAVGATIVLTRIGGYANDATLNLAITGELGVTAAASSANTTAGVAGVIIERVGGDGNDVYGKDLPTMSSIQKLVMAVDESSASFVAVEQSAVQLFPSLPAGAVTVMARPVSGLTGDIDFIANGAAILDVLVVAS